MLQLLLKAIVLTLATGLVGVYGSSQPYHYVKNGLPLPFLIQVVDIKAAKYVEVKLDTLFLLADVLFWACFLHLLGLSGRILKRVFSPRAKQHVSEHYGY